MRVTLIQSLLNPAKQYHTDMDNKAASTFLNSVIDYRKIAKVIEADKIPSSIAKYIDSNFQGVNGKIVQETVVVISSELVDHLTKLEK